MMSEVNLAPVNYMGEPANNDDGAEVQPETTTFRFDNDQDEVRKFIIIRAMIPTRGCPRKFLANFREHANVQWEQVPDKMQENWFDDTAGPQCGFRCMEKCKTQIFKRMGFRRHHAPQTGDWLMCGPGDLSKDIGPTDEEKYLVMDPMAFSRVFTFGEDDEDLSGCVGWYYCRPIRND